ncbi:ribosomal protein S12 methylthiotransferase RimO [Spirochaetia bacterium]|nr:ribosomal protein S12 methylthiotransferase RimO [Spirochaetia bacterium]
MFYFIDPFGCAKNQVDAETIMSRLNEAGWTAVDDPEAADLIIINSCGFIEAAKRESINAVLAWRNHYPEKKILLAGCLSQRYRAELEETLNEADGLLSCDEVNDVSAKAANLFGSAALDLPDIRPGSRPLLGFPGSAYVKISEGCNNACSFCAIPLIRGGLRCRSIPDVLDECTALLDRGIKELCLIGQDISSYEPGLAALLNAIAGLPGRFWVRLLYLHPDHFPLDILDLPERDNRFLPYFDIPFQHASPHILGAMGRTGSGESYLTLLDTIRRRLPGAVIRSTFLTGFPGETEDDFRLLLDFQQRARFDWLGVFTYSREEGTSAYAMKNRVAKKTAAGRKARIEEAQIPITEEQMNRFVGQTMDVLVEEALSPAVLPPQNNSNSGGDNSDNNSGGDNDEQEKFWLGRFFCQAPEVDGAAVIRISSGADELRPGSMVRGKVSGRAGFDLECMVTSPVLESSAVTSPVLEL